MKFKKFFPFQYNTKKKKHEMDFIKIKHFFALWKMLLLKEWKKNDKQS